jgi:hypothetical protein
MRVKCRILTDEKLYDDLIYISDKVNHLQLKIISYSVAFTSNSIKNESYLSKIMKSNPVLLVEDYSVYDIIDYEIASFGFEVLVVPKIDGNIYFEKVKIFKRDKKINDILNG